VLSVFESKKQQLMDELGSLGEPQERLLFLVECGRDLPALAPEFQVDAFRVPGCLSKLWICPRLEDGMCYFSADSDAQIPKGIAAILTGLLSGLKPSELRAVDPGFIEDLGIAEYLTPNRRNSLSRIVKLMQSFADVCLSCDGEACTRPSCPVMHDDSISQVVTIGGRSNEGHSLEDISDSSNIGTHASTN
jgi:cysteine desulfuration protein SufE